MPENCNLNDCPMESRIAALERANEQHGNTHREIFRRMNEVERSNAVQDAHYNAIMDKLDSLTAKHDKLNAKLEALEAKPGKRWDGLVDKLIWAIAGAVAAFLLARIGI